MSTFLKTAIYVIFMVAVFAIEHDIPVTLYYRRYKFLASWNVATFAQRRALKNYRSYQEEVEVSHG